MLRRGKKSDGTKPLQARESTPPHASQHNGHSHAGAAHSSEKDRIQAIFDATNVGMLLIAENGGIKQINDTVARLLGKRLPESLEAQPGELLCCIHAIQESEGCGHTVFCNECAIRDAFESVLRTARPKHAVETEVTRDVNGETVSTWLEISADPLCLDGERHVVMALNDITARKRIERKLEEQRALLQESESRVRRKLDSILSPEGGMGMLELGDVLDIQAIQSLMDDFTRLVPIPMAILDLKGNVLVKAGWQSICTDFHRLHPETRRNCVESDTQLSLGLAPGEYKVYKCKNNMWDIATPIIVGGEHAGNLFIGQFFFDDEPVPYDVFREQAQRYGFDESCYLAALEEVPRLSRETVNAAMGFFLNLSQLVSRLSFSNIKLARTVAERDTLTESLRTSRDRGVLLAETASVLLCSDRPQEVVNSLCDRVLKHLECHVYFNFLVDGAAGKLHLNSCGGIPEDEAERIAWLDYGVAVCGCVALEGCRIVSEHIPSVPDPRTDLVRSYGVKAYACHPLLGQNGAVIGTLSFGTRTRETFSDDDLSLMKAVADLVAVAIARLQMTTALRESEEKYRQIVENTHEGIWMFDNDGVTVFANQQMAGMLGYSLDEMVGHSFWEFLFEEDLEVARKARAHRLASNEGYQLEFRYRRKDGSPLWALVASNPIFSAEGRRQGTVGLFSDITERKAREEELRRLNRILRAHSHSDQAIMRAPDEAWYLQEICTIIVEDCGHAMTWIGYAEDDAEKTVRPVASAGFEEGYLETLNITWADTARGQGPTGTAIRTGRPCMCRNMLIDPKFAPWRDHALQRGYASSLVVPLMAGDKAFGAINIYSREPEAFSDNEAQLLYTLADDLAFGISALRLRAEHARSQEQLAVLSRFPQENPSPVMRISADHILLYSNDAGQDICRHWGCMPGGHIPLEIRFQVTEALVMGQISELEVTAGRRIYSLVFAPIPADAYVNVYGRDITERKCAEEALKQSNNEMERRIFQRTAELRAAALYTRTLIESSLDPLATISPDGKITDVSRAMEIATGVPREKLIGSNFADCFTEPEEAERGYQKVLAEGEVRDYPLTIRKRSGELVSVHYNATVYRNEAGEVQGVFAIARDITEQIRAQKEAHLRQQQLMQADKMVSLGILVAGVAHEINNPNHAIMTNAAALGDVWTNVRPILEHFHKDFGDFALGGYSYADQRDKFPAMYSDIVANSRRIQVIVDELRDFARYNPEATMAAVDLNAVVSSAVILVANLIRKFTDCFSVEYGKELPPVTGNRQRIEQVVINLVQNACQSLPSRDKGIAIRTFYDPVMRETGIAIQDQGKGIPEEELRHLGDPFFTTKRADGGLGLGLWVSYNIVHEHSGRLTFHSKENEGTLSILAFPIRPDEPDNRSE